MATGPQCKECGYPMAPEAELSEEQMLRDECPNCGMLDPEVVDGKAWKKPFLVSDIQASVEMLESANSEPLITTEENDRAFLKWLAEVDVEAKVAEGKPRFKVLKTITDEETRVTTVTIQVPVIIVPCEVCEGKNDQCEKCGGRGRYAVHDV